MDRPGLVCVDDDGGGEVPPDRLPYHPRWAQASSGWMFNEPNAAAQLTPPAAGSPAQPAMVAKVGHAWGTDTVRMHQSGMVGPCLGVAAERSA